MKGYFNKEELANYLGVSVATISLYTRQSKLPYYKMFGKNLYKKEEIDKLIEQSKVQCI